MRVFKVDFVEVDFVEVDFVKVDFVNVDFVKVDFVKVQLFNKMCTTINTKRDFNRLSLICEQFRAFQGRHIPENGRYTHRYRCRR